MTSVRELIQQIRGHFAFWNQHPSATISAAYLFNYRRLWWYSTWSILAVSLAPLLIISVLNYDVTEKAIESEYRLRTARIVSNTQRAIGFFLKDRKAALEFIINDTPHEDLLNPERLETMLANLKKSFGGCFVDIGILDYHGRQQAYVGPHELLYQDYLDQTWFHEVTKHGVYISDVFLGYRQVPHLVIAIKKNLPEGGFFVLRASLGIGYFEDLLSNLELGGLGDPFLINRDGRLQTPSQYHGGVLEKIGLPIPDHSEKTEVAEYVTREGVPLFIGYRFIANTPYVLMIVKQKDELLKPWYTVRLRLIAFLLASVSVILLVIVGTVTFIVGRIHLADEKRLMTLHQMEYASKMATIGRMAASVSHEINNPLAVIGEKAGLIKDLFTFKKQYADDPRLIGLVDSITACVQRAGRITRRLLTFARNLQAKNERVDLPETVNEVLGFVEREVHYRDIHVQAVVHPDLVGLCMDRGKLQQVILNIVNNALGAMNDGGHLNLSAQRDGNDRIRLDICDDGCGIPPEDLRQIFEPFFSTKKGKGGTGLGLSITYSLVQELGGTIEVKSTIGEGTCFRLMLPLKAAAECDSSGAPCDKEPTCESS